MRYACNVVHALVHIYFALHIIMCNNYVPGCVKLYVMHVCILAHHVAKSYTKALFVFKLHRHMYNTTRYYIIS